MEEIKIESVKQLAKEIQRLPDGLLFRGQSKHYVDETGAVSMPTSFARNGCEPPLQLKWSHYARFIHRALTGKYTKDLHQAQAILQHYGWRSFFIDVASNPAVGAWFASHAFESRQVLELCEDCAELPLFARHQLASYSQAREMGYLYVVDSTAVRQSGIELFDLTEIEATDCRPRFHAQSAWLIGPLRDNLPPEVIRACISGPAGVFSAYAAGAGLSGTSDLFPPRHEDQMLTLLLSVPWELVADLGGVPVFSRGLQLPEYDHSFSKIHPAHTAFFSPGWVADGRACLELEKGQQGSPDLLDAAIYRTPESAFYNETADDSRPLHSVTSALQRQRVIIFESDGILRHPEFHDSDEYMKGVYLRMVDERTVEVAELTIVHPGLERHGVGVSRGWYYAIDDDQCWTQISHEEACPCDNTLRHEHHLWIVATVDELLANGRYAKVSENCYACQIE